MSDATETPAAQDEALETALLGAGCFWCVEAVFDSLRGVVSVTPGYAGGHVDNPTYEQVCANTTGHVEVVQIRFDPRVIGYADLLRVFYTTHDPTTLNRQGNDVGEQYRSVIFALTPEQAEIAHDVTAEITAEGIWSDPIMTSIEGPARFWPAEAKHHDYFARNPSTAYCAAVVAPKVAKARKLFRDRLKSP